MIISYFHNAGDKVPAQSEVTWEDLTRSLADVRVAKCNLATCRRSECPHKNGPSWSCAQYKEGASRGLQGVIDVHALIVDLDHVPPENIDALLEKVLPYTCIVHASHSDREKDRCLRVVFKISRPVPAADWYRFWGQAVEELGLPADKQVKDPSRLYYLPSRPSDAWGAELDGNGYAYVVNEGEVLDVDAILSRAPALPEPEDYDFEIPEFTGAPDLEDLEAAVSVLAGAWPDTNRNTCQLALCGALARAGWPVDLITDFVEAVCEQAHPGNGDRTKRAKAARASVAKVQNGEMVAGWPTLEEYVDPDAVKAAIDALGMGGPKHDQTFVDVFKTLVSHESKVQNLVVVDRNDLKAALKAAKNKLARASDFKKIKEGFYLGKILNKEQLVDHADDDLEKATFDAMRALVKHAPRGTPPALLAEFFATSRSDLGTDELCQLVESVSAKVSDDGNIKKSSEFKLDQFGLPVPGARHNLELALYKLGYTFYYDEFARKKIVEHKVGESLFRKVVTDAVLGSIMFEIEQEFEFFPPKDKFYMFCEYKARLNAYHPVKNYLDGLDPWDGVTRTDRWLIDFGGAEDTPYVRAISRLMLVAAVRRVRQPGCKFDEMMILESPQGSYKSSAIKALCPDTDWFSDNFQLNGDTKKMIEQTAGKWIVEAGELRGMSAHDQNALKQYLSSTFDEARMAYAREPERLARQFVIIGTTNDTQYLKDHTGDRRYWPIRVKRFDVKGLLAIRDQLWAEASYLDLANPAEEYIRLDPSLYEAAAIEQANRKVDNAIKIRLDTYLGELNGCIKTEDVWRLVTDKPDLSPQLVSQISNVMHELGWERERIQKNKQRRYYYMKGTAEERNKHLLVSGNSTFGFTIKTVDVDEHGNPVIEDLNKSLTTN